VCGVGGWGVRAYKSMPGHFLVKYTFMKNLETIVSNFKVFDWHCSNNVTKRQNHADQKGSQAIFNQHLSLSNSKLFNP